MLKRLKDIKTYGMIYTLVLVLFNITLSSIFPTDGGLTMFQYMGTAYNVGIDSFGALICAALYYGCFKQKGEGSKTFRTLILLICACFTVNEVMIFTSYLPEQRITFFIFCLF